MRTVKRPALGWFAYWSACKQDTSAPLVFVSRCNGPPGERLTCCRSSDRRRRKAVRA